MKRLDQSWTGWKEGQVLRLGREPGWNPVSPKFTFCMATDWQRTWTDYDRLELRPHGTPELPGEPSCNDIDIDIQ